MITAKFNTDHIKVSFIYSPASELMTSLNVISNPSHHTNTQDWAIKRFSGLSLELQKEIKYIGDHYADWIFIIDVILTIIESSYPRKLSVEETVELMMDMDNFDFANLFLGLPAFNYSHDILQNWIDDPESITSEELGVQSHFLSLSDVKAFLHDINGMKTNLKKIILQYWEECFKFEWPSIESYFDTVIRKEQLVLQNTNCMDYISTLHPDLGIEDEDIVFHKEPDYRVPISEIRRLIIVPSVFTAPHLSGNFFEGTLDIAMNLNYHSVKMQDELSDEIFNIIFAASDLSRLKIIKILWNSDATTKEISEILNLSPSTVSLHLKILKEADLVETNKIKKFVYYKLKKDVFYKMQQGLIDYFEY